MKKIIAPFLILLFCSLLMVGCEKTPTPPEEEEEETADAIISELPEENTPFECTEGDPEPVSTFYTDEIANGICRTKIHNLGLTSGSSRAIGIIIKNQEAYDKYVQCSEFANTLDFDKYFVLVGVFRNYMTFLNSSDIFTCNNKIIFKINMVRGIGGDVGHHAFSMVVIEKKYINQEIVFDMQVKPW